MSLLTLIGVDASNLAEHLPDGRGGVVKAELGVAVQDEDVPPVARVGVGFFQPLHVAGTVEGRAGCGIEKP